MDSYTKVEGVLRQCCAKNENLKPMPRTSMNILTLQCTVCGRKHHRMLAATGRYFQGPRPQGIIKLGG